MSLADLIRCKSLGIEAQRIRMKACIALRQKLGHQDVRSRCHGVSIDDIVCDGAPTDRSGRRIQAHHFFGHLLGIAKLRQIFIGWGSIPKD